MVIDKLGVCFEKKIGIYLENLYSLEWITISRAKFKLKVSVEIREISFDRPENLKFVLSLKTYMIKNTKYSDIQGIKKI